VSSASGAAVHCPYCYEGFTAQQIRFRCSGRPGPEGRRCQPEPDEVLEAYTGSVESLPHVFTDDGRNGSAECPRSGATTTTRICPACHRRLPAQYAKIPSRLIALVGAKESGKTVFMTVLVHELMHRLGEQLDASISAADDTTGHQFASAYETPLYRGSSLLAPTTPARAHDRIPLVFRLTTGGTRLQGRNSRRRRSQADGDAKPVLLSFFDPAGEDLRSQESTEQNARYLAAADGIVLLLDPLQMPGGRKLAADGTRLPTQATDADTPVAVLRNITDLILRTEPDGLITRPLAIVFSKIDALQHDLKETSPLRQTPAQGAYFDERDSLEVHTEVQRLLSRWQGSLIDRIARQHYRRYRYFGVSALGETPTSANQVSPRGIRPYRVGNPLTWILGDLGLIPVKRG
jgi:Double-GTPase 2